MVNPVPIDLLSATGFGGASNNDPLPDVIEGDVFARCCRSLSSAMAPVSALASYTL